VYRNARNAISVRAHGMDEETHVVDGEHDRQTVGGDLPQEPAQSRATGDQMGGEPRRGENI